MALVVNGDNPDQCIQSDHDEKTVVNYQDNEMNCSAVLEKVPVGTRKEKDSSKLSLQLCSASQIGPQIQNQRNGASQVALAIAIGIIPFNHARIAQRVFSILFSPRLASPSSFSSCPREV
jgi:hypothetical protein